MNKKGKHSTDSELMQTWMSRKTMIALRKIANNRKCSVAGIVRSMIEHHIDFDKLGTFIGRMPKHRF